MRGLISLLLLVAILQGVAQSVKIQQKVANLESMESLVAQLSSQTSQHHYNLKTSEGFNMDCLKAIKNKYDNVVGVFHSSIQQPKSGYNALYYAKSQNSVWSKVIRLSERGSQGTIFQLPNSTGFLVLYELQNHEHGNTIAIRYYQNPQTLAVNNFLYEYQLIQINDGKRVVNIGTPSVDSIVVTKQETDAKFSEFRLNIKYHYCPDGQNDFPGYGHVNLKPLRDFVDSKSHWIGGCKENYTDWQGLSDVKVENAIRKINIQGKIGQRDLFELNENGQVNKYYFYEANLNKAFDWHNWRIVLYSQKDDRAIQIPFVFNEVVDLANPHISQLSYSAATKEYLFWISFFIPSQGVKPNTGAQAGEFTAVVTVKL